MINIRKCLEEDEIFVVSSRIDEFLGNRDFYEVENDLLMKKKLEIEEALKKDYDSCKIIINDREPIGSFSVVNFKDGVLLDYLSIKTEFNRPEVKEFIIKYVVSSNYGMIYTYVYKNNISDVDVFKKMGFEVLEEAADRILMKYNNF